jgi:hypothetical protein
LREKRIAYSDAARQGESNELYLIPDKQVKVVLRTPPAKGGIPTTLLPETDMAKRGRAPEKVQIGR